MKVTKPLGSARTRQVCYGTDVLASKSGLAGHRVVTLPDFVVDELRRRRVAYVRSLCDPF
jgi:hypothetical protein